MTTPFIAKLQVPVIHECGICRTIKLLEYVTSDERGNVTSVCEGCRDDIMKENEPPGGLRE